MTEPRERAERIAAEALALADDLAEPAGKAHPVRVGVRAELRAFARSLRRRLKAADPFALESHPPRRE